MTVECVFCQIARGVQQARMVMETDDLLCFFPLRPNLLGHTLISTRAHYAHVGDCAPTIGTSVFSACQALDRHYAKVIGSAGFNLLNASGNAAGQSVDHLHFHFMPRIPGDGLDTWPNLPSFETDLDELLDRLSLPGTTGGLNAHHS